MADMTHPFLEAYDVFLVDIDGVLVRGAEPIPDAPAAVAELVDAGRVLLLTNNSTRSRAQHAARLCELGFPIEPDQILPSSYLAATHLRDEYGSLSVWVVGEQGLRDELTAAGHSLASSPEGAAALVVGMDRAIDYDGLAAALAALQGGARFIATNEDRTFPVPGAVLPGAGAMVGALRGMGFAPDVVIGKPSPIAYRIVLRDLDVDPKRVVMIGDRLETDIAGGIAAGIATALVLSGISALEDVDRSGIRPTWVVDDIAALVRGEATRPDVA